MNEIEKDFVTTARVKNPKVCASIAKSWAISFAEYMQDEAELYDQQHEHTHSLDEHYQNFLETYEPMWKMTRDNFLKAAHLFDREAKLEKLKKDIEQAVPQFQYDPDYKEIGEEIYQLIDKKLITIRQQIELLWDNRSF